MQRTRRTVQLAFLTLTVTGVLAVGPSVETWCPMGGVEALYTYYQEGNLICSLGISNFYILGGILLSALVVRRAFCGYLCPLGTISEWIGAIARRLRIPAVPVGGRVDRVLALGKYLVLGAVLWFTWRTGELMFRGYDPCYALISRHGADITLWAYVTAGAIALASAVVALPFCRWFCPFAAVLHPFSRFALGRIRRSAEHCSGCKQCSRACPMAIPVHETSEVTASRCISCMNCVDRCPQKARAALTWGPPASLGRSWRPGLIVLTLLVCVAGAVSAARFFPMPSFVKTVGTPPPRTATVELKVENLTCRGRANLLVWFLSRDDLALPLGFFRLEAWPDARAAAVRITYDPVGTDEEGIKRAITEPYFQFEGDSVAARWFKSPFRIQGYDPL